MVSATDCKVVIQARMGSKRYPGKVLAELDGAPMLSHQVKLVQAAGFTVAVATTVNPLDDSVAELCNRLGIECFRGDEFNVYSRYHEIARSSSERNIVRLTGDNPVVCREILREVLRQHLAADAGFSSTRTLSGHEVHRYLPKGWSVDVIKTSEFQLVDPPALDRYQQEHVIPVFYTVSARRHIVRTFEGLTIPACSIDTPGDMQALIARMAPCGGITGYAGLMDRRVLQYLQRMETTVPEYG